eukprot:502905-Pelagomonas_calceolata.AAC.3
MFTCSHHARYTSPPSNHPPSIPHSSSLLPSPLLIVLPSSLMLPLLLLHGGGCFSARPKEQLAKKEQLWKGLLRGGLRDRGGRACWGPPDHSYLSLSQNA